MIQHDGKTKCIYSTDREDQVILEFKDSEAQFDGEKKAKFKNKGLLRSAISHTLFEYLESYNIPTHYNSKINGNQMRARNLKMIPLNVVIRNVAAGSLCKRFNIKKGTSLQYPVIEYYLKDETLNYPLIHESHAYAFGLATPDEMKHVSRLSSKINAVLKSFLDRRKLKLVDYNLEFGRYRNYICLGDEITPDTARIWEIENDSLNEKYFSFDNNKAQQSYSEIHDRIVGE